MAGKLVRLRCRSQRSTTGCARSGAPADRSPDFPAVTRCESCRPTPAHRRGGGGDSGGPSYCGTVRRTKVFVWCLCRQCNFGALLSQPSLGTCGITYRILLSFSSTHFRPPRRSLSAKDLRTISISSATAYTMKSTRVIRVLNIDCQM